MRHYVKTFTARVLDHLADHIARRIMDRESLADGIAYRVALETMLKESLSDGAPNELFSGISDDFWLWLHTEGYRKNSMLRRMLPGMPDEHVQLMFTGSKGDIALREGFAAYRLFKELYESHAGRIARCKNILDFGCGWGRIIRFFLKDVEPFTLWGCDPVGEMINLCQQYNKFCNFNVIEKRPPSLFQDNTFDLIYSFSVFSHLSEEMHQTWLHELSRILKPGGLLLATTRGREFIEDCARLRQRQDLDSIHAGPRSSAAAFLSTQECLAAFDSGTYCFSQLVHEGEWSYWGETAIPKDYVLTHWTPCLTFLDYIDDRRQCTQNVIAMQKPVEKTVTNSGSPQVHNGFPA